MCEKHYCTHSPETLLLLRPGAERRCGPNRISHGREHGGHPLGTGLQKSWGPERPSALRGGKCRQCGGRLCAGQYPVDAQTPEDFLAAVYRQLNQFHRRLDAALSHPAFRERFAAMFHEEDRPFVEDWLVQREAKTGDKTEGQKAYTIVHTAAYADRGVFLLQMLSPPFLTRYLPRSGCGSGGEGKGRNELSLR